MSYLIHLTILISIFSILSLSLNLVVGYTGLLSITHAAFYGIGAYATALLMRGGGLNFFVAVVVSVIITALISLLIGMVLSRFRGDYYALGSLGFNVIVFSVLLNWSDLTRGALGIPGIPKPEIFGIRFADSGMFLILALGLGVLVYLIARFIAQSSFGRALKAIREDEGALQVFGYNTVYYKLVIFVISAGMAAIAGSLFATYITFIDPTSFTVVESIFVLAIIILGGLGNIQGSVLGAAILILLPEFLRFVGFPSEIAAQMRQLVYGVILVILMRFRPQGLVGEYRL